MQCTASGDGYGPSDHTPFYAAGVPVLHFFTGRALRLPQAHRHGGQASTPRARRRSPSIVADVGAARSMRRTALTYRKVPPPAPARRPAQLQRLARHRARLRGAARRAEGRAARRRARRAARAEQAGLQRGDILVRLGTHAIGGVEDLMYVLNASKPGETVTAVVLRDGKEVPSLEVTFQESKLVEGGAGDGSEVLCGDLAEGAGAASPRGSRRR